MTVKEFNLRMKGLQLSELDKSFRVYQQAWADMLAQGHDEKGKPVFKDFNDLFDYESAERKIRGQTSEEKAKVEALTERAERAKRAYEAAGLNEKGG